MALDVFITSAGSALLEYRMIASNITINRIVLASGSPRRYELLSQLGYPFEVIVPQVEELRLSRESPEDYVKRLSKEKALAAKALLEHMDGNAQDTIFIGSDTIVVSGLQVMEKPVDLADAQRMLTLLSNGSHQVMTAVTLAKNDTFKTVLVITDVWFKSLSAEEIKEYWDSGEPQDKAGSYAIQGIGGKFVIRIDGSYHAVVGLPLFETEQLLQEFL